MIGYVALSSLVRQTIAKKGILKSMWKMWLLSGLGFLLVENLAAQEVPSPSEKQVVLETRYGVIVMDLFADKAPLHVEAFLS